MSFDYVIEEQEEGMRDVMAKTIREWICNGATYANAYVLWHEMNSDPWHGDPDIDCHYDFLIDERIEKYSLNPNDVRITHQVSFAKSCRIC